MPNLGELLSHQAERLIPGPPPPFSTLQDRARRRHRTKIVGAWGTSLIAVTAIAVGVPQALGSSHRHGEPVSASQPTVAASNNAGFQSTAAIAATKLSTLGAADADFTTVAVDAQHQSLIVYRKGGGASSVYPASVDGIPVQFGSALLSAIETRATIDAISAAEDDLSRVGIAVRAVTASVSGPVQVQVQNPSSSMTAEIARYAPYGASSIQIVSPDTVIPGPLPQFVSSASAS